MSAIKLLNGNVYGSLTVVSRDMLSKSTKIKWTCKCSCGNIVSVSSTHLIQGHTTSCRHCKPAHNFIDLSGKVYGELTAVSYVRQTKKYTCKCSCGNTIDIAAVNLKSGNTKSCGCQARSLMRDTIADKYLGATINGLVLESPTEMTDVSGHIIWNVRCVCGSIFNRPTSLIINGHTKSCGCLSKSLKSLANGGTGIPYENYTLYQMIRAQDKYQAWRVACLIVCNHKCAILKKRTNDLQIHHIVPLNVLISQYGITKDNIESFTEILFDVNNGIVLSEAIHREFHAQYGHQATQEMLTEFITNYNQEGLFNYGW